MLFLFIGNVHYMNILLVGVFPISANEIHGGVEASVYGLATELAKEHSVAVLDMPRAGVMDAAEVIDGVTVYRFNLKGKRNIDAVKSVDKYLQLASEIRPDVCHLHGASIFNEILFRRLTEIGLPTVITVHGILDVEQKNALDKKFTLKRLVQWRYQRFFERRLLEECGETIVDTGYVKEMLTSLKLKRVPEMHIIPQGINEDFFSIRHNGNGKRRIILSVGGFGQRKGHLYTMMAFDKVAKEFDDVDLVFAGCVTDTAYMNKMLALKNELTSGNKITIMPDVERSVLFDLYAKASIFALHSEEESQGIVFAEAMAAGLPVVATNVGGIPYVVNEGKNGLLSAFADVDAFATNMKRLLSDSSLCTAISNNNVLEAKNYNWKIIAENVMGVYEKEMRKECLTH